MLQHSRSCLTGDSEEARAPTKPCTRGRSDPKAHDLLVGEPYHEPALGPLISKVGFRHGSALLSMEANGRCGSNLAARSRSHERPESGADLPLPERSMNAKDCPTADLEAAQPSALGGTRIFPPQRDAIIARRATNVPFG